MEEKRKVENMLLRQQCQEISNYVNQYPIEECEQRMLEWIEKYAPTYRANMESILDFVERALKEDK